MADVSNNSRINFRTYSNYGYYWIVIVLMLVSCTKFSGDGDYYFYFSWDQYRNEHTIGYCRNEFGCIMPYTDYADAGGRRYANPKYRKSYMFVGKGWKVDRSKVNKEKVIFPAKMFNPDADY